MGVMEMLNLSGKKFGVFGVLDTDSIGFGITTYLAECGAGVVVHCQTPNIAEKRVRPHLPPGASQTIVTADVTKDDEMDACFAELAKLAPFDGFVHSIAGSDRRQLKGPFKDVTRENFRKTMEVSCFSLIDIARRAVPLMPNGGGIVALSHDAADRFYPNYNVMAVAKAGLETSALYLAADLGRYDIRVKCVRASPQETFSAKLIGDFVLIGDYAENKSPLLPPRRATMEEIAFEVACRLVATGDTGTIMHVDRGANFIEIPVIENLRGFGGASIRAADRIEGTRTDLRTAGPIQYSENAGVPTEMEIA